MEAHQKSFRVLYSFPNKLGGERICYTAWQQVKGLVSAGAEVHVFAASKCRPLPSDVEFQPTLARGGFRVPFKLLGKRRARALHDHIVAASLRKLAGHVDIVHTWPSGARRTLEVAVQLGIPSVLERCNSHTRYAYEVVAKECDRLGVHLPAGYESAFDEDVLRLEEKEFRLADRLLCPSDFVVQSFLAKGFSREQLARHQYGFDEERYFPSPDYQPNNSGLRMLFVGVCAVRKGLHYALQAWLESPAHTSGTFSIAGEFLPQYAEKLRPMLCHPSIRVLGQRNDVPELMRNHDVLVLPSLEEGSALVCSEALGTGCVPLVSAICVDPCRHMQNALIHELGDVEALSRHITMLHDDRELLRSLREAGLAGRENLTWKAAGRRLLEVYRETVECHRDHPVAAA